MNADRPPYWLQVNHHFFFVLYSFVAMGIITVFEWDLFFPDLLDVFVLTTLPIQDRKLFQARVSAIAIFIVGFLLDANFLAPLVIPASFDPLNLPRLLIGHLSAVLAGGLFSAVFILALQGVLLSVLGERLFRRIALVLQGLSITVLLMLLFLFPVLSGAVPLAGYLTDEERLRARFPHAVSLRYDDPRTGAIVDFGSDGSPIEERTDESVVLEFLEEVRDRKPSASERALVLDALAEAHRGARP